MIALNLVERELRVRARQPFTIWLRLGVAAAATLMALSWSQQATGLGPAQTGRTVFSVLAWLCFGIALFEGARQTTDTISGERREGTLGLLFLTDLGGLDIALGKLAAASLHSFYGLLAVFPVLGITLAVGGITAGEFWRTQLALVTTLLLAAAGGLWISAHSRDPLRALLAGLGLMMGLVVVPLLWDSVSGLSGVPSLSPAAGLWLAGDAAYGVDPRRFWLTQLALAGLAGFFVLAAGRRTARAWREGADPPRLPAAAPGRARPEPGWGYRIPPRLHARPDARLLEAAPTRWLAGAQRGVTPLVWLALMLPALTLVGVPFVVPFLGPVALTTGALSVLNVGLKVLGVAILTTVAARPLGEIRRSGGLELLLCTPVTGKQIVWAHWDFLWTRVRPPLVLCVVGPTVVLLGVWMVQAGRGNISSWGFFLLVQGPALVVQVVTVVATCWVGLWLGARTRTAGQAIGQSLLLVAVGPWLIGTLAHWIVVRFVTGRGFPGSGGVWVLWSLPSWITLAWLAGLLVWARRELLEHFREIVSEGGRAPGFSWMRRKKPSPPPPVSA